MSWTLADRRKARLEPVEHPPPPPPVTDDDQPLPSYIAGMPDDTDDTSPPLGWGALRVVSQDQGMLTTDQLSAFSWLMRRGIHATQDDTKSAVPLRRSAHEPPPGYRP